MSINLGKTYDLVDSYQLSEGEYSSCQHCGKPIKNICEIQNEEGIIYNVGSSCVNKLLELDGSDYWKNEEIKKQITKYFNGLRLMNKALIIGSCGDLFIGVLLANPQHLKDKSKKKYNYKVLDGKIFKPGDFRTKEVYIGDHFESLYGLEKGIYENINI